MRTKWIDIAKGIGIITVVAYHARLTEYISMFSLLINLMIPIFYFSSGYCFSTKRFIRRRLNVFVPFVLINSILILINNSWSFMYETYGKTNVLTGFAKTVIGGVACNVSAPAWFIVSLVMIQILCLPLIILVERNGFFTIPLMLLWCGLSLWVVKNLDVYNSVSYGDIYNFNIIVNVVIGGTIFWSGYVFKKYESIIDGFNNVIITFIGLVAFVIFCYICENTGYSFDFRSGICDGRKMLPIVISSGLVFIVLFLKSFVNVDSVIAQWLIFMGKHTLWIALLHIMFFQFVGFVQNKYYGVPKASFRWTNTYNYNVYWELLCTVVGIAGPIVMEWLFIILKNKMTNMKNSNR